MAWPVTVNGVTYTAASFAGANYVSALPNFFQDVATHYSLGFSGTSSSSITIGTGSKSLTIESGRLFSIGQPVTISRSASPSTSYMDGRVTAYNPSTGSMTVDVGVSLGSGTFTSWNVSIGGARVAGTLPLSVSEGGTGSTSGAGALSNLGVSSPASTFLTQSTISLLRTVGIGMSSIGESISTAADQAAVRSILGVGASGGGQVMSATSISAIQTLLGLGTLAYLSAITSLSISDSTVYGRNLLTAASISAQRGSLGLGTLATQNSDSVAITGGTITGISNIQSTVPFSIPADSVLVIPIGGSHNGIISIASNVPQVASGLVSFRCDVGSTSVKLCGPSSLVVSTGIKTGTSGSVGTVTVSPHSDGNLYIENRLSYSFMGSYSIQPV